MDTTKIITAIITLLVAIAEAFIIPWIKTKIDANKLATLLELVKMAVQAAEQLFGSGTGVEKKQYVIDYLNSKGIKFDEATIDAAIEAAVLEMNNELLKKNV